MSGDATWPLMTCPHSSKGLRVFQKISIRKTHQCTSSSCNTKNNDTISPINPFKGTLDFAKPHILLLKITVTVALSAEGKGIYRFKEDPPRLLGSQSLGIDNPLPPTIPPAPYFILT